jgi:septum formation topological specificity factor MinE
MACEAAAILDADTLGVVDHHHIVAGRPNGEDRQFAKGLVHWMERHGVEVDHRWCKHVLLDPEKVQIKMDRGGTVSTLEVDIEVPKRFGKMAVNAA